MGQIPIACSRRGQGSSTPWMWHATVEDYGGLYRCVAGTGHAAALHERASTAQVVYLLNPAMHIPTPRGNNDSDVAASVCLSSLAIACHVGTSLSLQGVAPSCPMVPSPPFGTAGRSVRHACVCAPPLKCTGSSHMTHGCVQWIRPWRM